MRSGLGAGLGMLCFPGSAGSAGQVLCRGSGAGPGQGMGAGGSPRQAVAAASGAYPAWQRQRKEPRLLMHSP